MSGNKFNSAQDNNDNNVPQVNILAQYIKDLSFENPNAPAVYQWQTQPHIEVQFNIGTQAMAQDVYEVALKIDVSAKTDDGIVFHIELVYSGLFAIKNVPADQIQPFLYIEAPRILFPFVRRILADCVRDGNFPPLMLEPLDFAALYMQQAEQQDMLSNAEPAGQA
ncbi:MAG: protein-export chaperone SecB [Zymomonas mobilis subsp. pomaceae]|uniref:Protein-export protein SecB n=1 Tax=Zymomonas mobilis subsp. pomaceae (strain ATCC 29192 / DSM 22645 / JCM 10191 / CCUG 17912 / NBRC 13757 / NCIMB 11200 / NRRL B-4491 / Barker I) TaxID=579138 RepID=F8EVN0_ZYMMT|nr:protein-export chaperone SecB [Zymomonas mobilis]AEI38367.1 protein-export protein SecB [Zymomonas mobilis subsp. pomaceae ATCC 29192]MDX5948056.1 protein-export chaperone SecB [Zymomonas mobilis subsp. pomaceae]GEB89386.1 protein-export protein SecB [Zymomonas mobilis subsp. pomaceae]